MKRMDRKAVKYFVIHCSDTKPGQACNAETIDAWHRQRGFEMIGYHYVILPDGTVEHGRPLFCEGAHCVKGGMNHKSIGICYVGGRDSDGKSADTRTTNQKLSMQHLLLRLHSRYPQAVIIGHRDADNGKVCPCFKASSLNQQVFGYEWRQPL